MSQIVSKLSYLKEFCLSGSSFLAPLSSFFSSVPFPKLLALKLSMAKISYFFVMCIINLANKNTNTIVCRRVCRECFKSDCRLESETSEEDEEENWWQKESSNRFWRALQPIGVFSGLVFKFGAFGGKFKRRFTPSFTVREKTYLTEERHWRRGNREVKRQISGEPPASAVYVILSSLGSGRTMYVCSCTWWPQKKL